MKQVSMLYKRLNFNSTSESRFKLKASLKHSLRIVDGHNALEKEGGLQWDESRTDSNLVFINNELKVFENFSLEDREKFLDDCFAPPQPKNKSALIKNYSAYKIKLENAIDKETNSEAKAIYQSVRDFPKSEEFDVTVFIEQLSVMDIVRKNQRIGMIQKFADAHNSLLNTIDKKRTYIQEGLFKFPKPKNNEKFELTNELNDEDYIFHMRNFLTKNFQDYDIKAIFAHRDEHKIHSHYFLSGVNNKTNELDLHKREIEVVNNYIATLNGIDLEAELIPEHKKLNHAERQRFARYFQRFFYDFTNENLLLEKGIQATIASEAERKSDIAIDRNLENRLPIGLRTHNFATLKAEMAEERALEAENKSNAAENRLIKIKADGDAHIEKVNSIAKVKIEKIKEINEEISTGKVEITNQEKQLNEVEKLIEEKKSDLATLNKEIKSRVTHGNSVISQINERINEKNNELDDVNTQVLQAKSVLEGFTEQLTSLVGGVVKNIYVRSLALMKDSNLATDYMQKIMSDYIKIAPKFLRDICKTAASGVNDTEIVLKMTNKDQELDSNSKDD